MKKEIKITIWVIVAILLIVGIYFVIKSTQSPATLSANSMNNSLKDKISNLFANKTIIKNGGACILIDSASSQKKCTFTIKENCDGNFSKGLLCTAEELETECAPINQSVKIENKDYFIDSCGNQANPYDSSQFRNKTYWTNYLQ